MAEKEEKEIVIGITANASKFIEVTKAAMLEAIAGMEGLGKASAATVKSVESVGESFRKSHEQIEAEARAFGVRNGLTEEAIQSNIRMKETLNRSSEEMRKAQESIKSFGAPAIFQTLIAEANKTKETFEELARAYAQFQAKGKAGQDALVTSLVAQRDAAAAAGDAAAIASKKASAGANTATVATIKWAGALKIVKGILSLLGIASILGAFKSFIGFLKEATEVAAEFSFNTYRLQIGVRAAQREMGLAAGTMEEWSGFVQDLRKQFQIFSLTDLTAATAKVILLTRELGFTKEAMMDVTRASIVLAEVSGRDVEDAARRLALFLDTGYARGLAQLGVQISKTSVEQYALSQGIDKTYNSMGRAERATLGLGAVMEQVNRLMEDAGLAANTMKGQFMLLRAAQKDAMADFGRQAGFIFLAWERGKTLFVTSIVPAIVNSLAYFTKVAIVMAGKVVKVITTEIFLIQKAIDAAKGSGQSLKEIWAESIAGADQAEETWNQTFKDMLFPMQNLGDVSELEMGVMASSMLEAGETAKKVTAEDFKKFGEDVREALTNAADAATDMKLSMERDFEDLSLKLERDFQDAFTDLLRDLEDVEVDYNQKRADLIAKAAQDEREVVGENTDKRAELLAEYRLEEIQAQREFNLEMAQLEREYLFSLEDAVRERDARSVLMLMRKHNLEVQERTEDFVEQRRQRKENLELELAQIRQGEARKRREIRDSLNKELADLQKHMYRAAQEKYKDYLRELEDIALKNRQAKEDLDIEYRRRETDLDEHLRRRLILLGKRFAEEFNLTVSFVRSITAQLVGLAGVYSSFLQTGMLSGATPAYAMPTVAYTGGYGSGRSYSTPTVRATGGYAEGGLAVARKPTPAVFGEGGPEAAMFMPLNRLKEFGGGFGTGGQGRIALDINVEASPDLVVSIVDRTMSEVAEVIMRASG